MASHLTQPSMAFIVSKSSFIENSHFWLRLNMASNTPSAPRKHPRQSRARATVDAMLDAAAHILVGAGYEGFNTNKVAHQAGVSIGSLYQYFPNKAALLAALRHRHAEQMQEMLMTSLTGAMTAPLDQAVRSLVAGVMAAHRIHPALHQVLEQHVPRQTQHSSVTDWEIQLRQQLQAWLQLHQSELCIRDPQLASLMLVRLVDALVHSALTADQMGAPTDAIEAEISVVVLRYLRGSDPA